MHSPLSLSCAEVHLNQSSPISEFPGYSENSNDTSLLVSPLLVAGVVIGLVLFLSCVTIIVGSLRKDGRLRHPHPRREANYGEIVLMSPDGFSYGGSIGELRSTCTEEFPPAFDFGSYMETLSQVNIMYPDSPPCYDECIEPGATQIYIPTDDPPPYSLTDPFTGTNPGHVGSESWNQPSTILCFVLVVSEMFLEARFLSLWNNLPKEQGCPGGRGGQVDGGPGLRQHFGRGGPSVLPKMQSD
uniref:BEAN1 n=1 Tax=Chelonoidis abingdonii TaxID=106734 RepID=A0A8C0GQJ1_CHEAB